VKHLSRLAGHNRHDYIREALPVVIDFLLGHLHPRCLTECVAYVEIAVVLGKCARRDFKPGGVGPGEGVGCCPKAGSKNKTGKTRVRSRKDKRMARVELRVTFLVMSLNVSSE
jgi:hypothetical protein